GSRRNASWTSPLKPWTSTYGTESARIIRAVAWVAGCDLRKRRPGGAPFALCGLLASGARGAPGAACRRRSLGALGTHESAPPSAPSLAPWHAVPGAPRAPLLDEGRPSLGSSVGWGERTCVFGRIWPEKACSFVD